MGADPENRAVPAWFKRHVSSFVLPPHVDASLIQRLLFFGGVSSASDTLFARPGVIYRGEYVLSRYVPHNYIEIRPSIAERVDVTHPLIGQGALQIHISAGTTKKVVIFLAEVVSNGTCEHRGDGDVYVFPIPRSKAMRDKKKNVKNQPFFL